MSDEPNDRRARLAKILAAKAKKSRVSDSPYLVLIREQGDQPPMIWIHPSSGFIGYYYALLELVPNDVPIWAIRPPGMDGEAEFPQTFEGFAEMYVDIITAARPEGPYVLGGWSNGGSIAFEIGRRLRQQGREVGFVALIDTPTDLLEDLVTRTVEQRIDYGAQTVVYMAELRGIEVPYDKARAAICEEALKAGPQPADTRQMWHESFARLFQCLYKLNVIKTPNPPSLALYETLAVGGYFYKPQPTDFPIAFFRAAESMYFQGTSSSDCYGWEHLTSSQVEPFLIPGHHYTIFKKPFVEDLGRQLVDVYNRRVRR